MNGLGAAPALAEPEPDETDPADAVWAAVSAVQVSRRMQKRKFAAALVASAAEEGERSRLSPHHRVPRTPMLWTERMRLSDNAFGRRYRMPKIL